jgi:septum formation protein
VVDDAVFGKPRDVAEAAEMLRALSDRSHDVLTAVAVSEDHSIQSRVDRTTVRMRPIADDEIHAYIATGEPLDKAGAYAIQGGAGAFVRSIEGALDTVIGLPVETARVLLDAARPVAR